jgi:hypothetical protein
MKFGWYSYYLSNYWGRKRIVYPRRQMQSTGASVHPIISRIGTQPTAYIEEKTKNTKVCFFLYF